MLLERRYHPAKLNTLTDCKVVDQKSKMRYNRVIANENGKNEMTTNPTFKDYCDAALFGLLMATPFIIEIVKEFV
jgi:hypothetical protein